MKQKLILCGLLPILSACELLPNFNNDTSKSNQNAPKNQATCIWKVATDKSCDMDYWFRYWSDIETLSWSQRKRKLEVLSAQGDDLLKKILLCQGKDTPYQDRLRAQLWVEAIMPELTVAMRKFIQVAIYQPNLQILELESALVTQSKLNNRNLELIDKQKAQITKQNNQIDQLLKIETSIMSNGQRNIE